MASDRKRPRPKVGDDAWFVEWCVKLGWTDGERNRDEDVYRTRRADTRAQAESIARDIFALDAYGSVAYWPAIFVAYDEDDVDRYSHAGFWEPSAEAIHYEGPDDAA